LAQPPQHRLPDIAAVVDHGRLHAAVDLARERIERLQGTSCGQIGDRLHQGLERIAVIQGDGHSALIGRLRRRCEGDVVADERQENIVRVIAQQGCEKGEIAGDVSELSVHTALALKMVYRVCRA
jgi:hypothetical protein